MPRLPILSLALVLSGPALFAQSALDALVETKRFHVPGESDQVDVNLSIIGGTTTWLTDERGFQQAKVEALTLVEQGGTIVDYRKTVVSSPERADTLQGDFMHQERFVLPPGEYALTVELRDLVLGDTARSTFHLPLLVAQRPDAVSFSDIEFTARPDRHAEQGTVPFAGTYYPPEVTKLGFYTEIYNAPRSLNGDSLFLVTCQIEDYDTRRVVGAFKHVQRAKAAPTVPVGMEFGIDKLPSGNYLLSVEARDRQGDLLGRQEQFFQRNNPLSYDVTQVGSADFGPSFVDQFTDPDTLAEHLHSLRPIATEMERKIIEDRWMDKDLRVMKNFMYTFWYNRNGYDPAGEWERYRKAVVRANQLFGCRNMRGYESDQGYVYLKYGEPNTVVDRSNETSTIPYLIWHYYRAGKYTDKRFVFWQPERSTTCWALLHSEVPGELKNPRWNQMLHQTDIPWNSGGGTSVPGVSGQEVLDNYNNPR